MAGTPNDFKLNGRVLAGGLLWGGLAQPTTGNRLTVAPADSDGLRTPDATQNPNAYPIGATKDAIEVSAKSSRKKFYADQISGAIDSITEQVEAMIKANIYAINDAVTAKLLSAGFGTQTIASGYVQNTIGEAVDAFTSVALIAPMRNDPSKIFVFHLYKTINDSGFAFGVSRTDLASSAINLDGYAVPTRPAADRMGNWWWET